MLQSRRSFLRFLAASPLATLPAVSGCGGTRPRPVFIDPDPDPAREPASGVHDAPFVISSPAEALDVFEFEAAARDRLPPAHFGYIATGVEGDLTLARNHEAYGEIRLRPHRLVDVSRVDTGIELFGERWSTPIIVAPCGSQRAFHPEGELATARAAGARGHLQVLSSVTTTSVEDVADARRGPVWYQLYPTPDWDTAQRLVRRAEGAGSPALVLTVDSPAGSDRDALARWVRADRRECARCHDDDQPYDGKPMYDGIDMAGKEIFNPAMDWDYVGRLRDSTGMRLVLKGIVRSDDAERAVATGVDAIIVSNHGGRSEESGRATIESLPEVVTAVGGRIPVLVDGGIRRGNDILKALASGADAILIGRPYLWGLAAFGQAGVEAVLALLTDELELAMRFAGTPTIADIDGSLIALSAPGGR